LQLGTDTLARIAEKNAFVQKELEAWRELSASTDFDDTAKSTAA
jgi:hypothetical protein